MISNAATFFYKGYRFDVGATLVGGFHSGGPHQIVGGQLGLTWPIRSVGPAMQVHLPNQVITRWGDGARWREERVRVFGSQAEKFWLMQERVADAAWNFSAHVPTWPVASISDAVHLSSTVRPDLIPIAPLAFTNVRAWPRSNDVPRRTIVDRRARHHARDERPVWRGGTRSRSAWRGAR